MEFSAGSCIRTGWETFKKRPWFVLGVFLLTYILSGALSFRSQTTSAAQFTPALIATLVAALVAALFIQTLVRMGKINFTLKAHDSIEAARLRDIWFPHPFWRYVGASILVGLVVMIGFILLIVPGIIWGVRYMFVPYLVIERNLGPVEAMRESSRITYGHKWELLGLVGLIFLLNVLGFICLIVGLLVTAPVSSLAVAHAYRTLEQKAGPISAA